MIHRAILGLAVTTCLVACLGQTTSLGGPTGNQSSASSHDDGGSVGPASTDSPPASDEDAGAADAALYCAWYSWKPKESSVACEYLIPAAGPSGDPVQEQPALDPFFALSHQIPPQVGTVFITPDPQGGDWQDGIYVPTGDDCGGSYGFHYDVDPMSTGQTPTRIVLCPASCADVNLGKEVRISAIWICGPEWGPRSSP
jgi:hypothetical protein